MSRIDGFEFVARALTHQGKPYIFGAKGPKEFDCSGLVSFTILECGGPDWRATHNAAKLFSAGVLEPYLPELEQGFPRFIPPAVVQALRVPAGTLIFYDDPVDHVMVVTGDGRVVGACGGDRTTRQPKPGACVQFRPTLTYRPRVRGFRLLPQLVS